LDNEKNWLATS